MDEASQPPPSSSGVSRWLLIILTLLVVVAFGAFAFYLIRSVARAPFDLAERAIEKKEEPIDITTVVTQISELGRLETAAMRVSHVSTIRQSYGVIPQSLAGDELTLFAVGDVIAGIDLTAITPADVHVEPGRVLVMRLPPSQILVSRLDNQKTRVVDRETGVFRRSDRNLESRARAHAERGIRREALNNGLLPLASRNAEKTLAQLFLAMGIDRVRFEQGKPLRVPGD